MSTASGARDETQLLKRARDGDEGAFAELVGGFRSELRGYCYRMLGSVQDAEDTVQNVMLRAWRGLSGFEGRGSVRSWLYSIAANAALDSARHGSRRELPVDFGHAAARGAEVGAPVLDPVWLDPYPDQWLTNGQLAVGCYLREHGSSRYAPWVIDVLTLDGDKITGVTGFLMLAAVGSDAGAWPADEEVFRRFGLPAELA